MVLCPHCDSDMTIHEVHESRDCGTHFYEECIYKCPLCCELYRLTEMFVLANRKLERME